MGASKEKAHAHTANWILSLHLFRWTTNGKPEISHGRSPSAWVPADKCESWPFQMMAELQSTTSKATKTGSVASGMPCCLFNGYLFQWSGMVWCSNCMPFWTRLKPTSHLLTNRTLDNPNLTRLSPDHRRAMAKTKLSSGPRQYHAKQRQQRKDEGKQRGVGTCVEWTDPFLGFLGLLETTSSSCRHVVPVFSFTKPGAVNKTFYGM